MVRVARFERATPTSQMSCPTIELHPDIEFYMWSPLWSAMWSNGDFSKKCETGKYGKSEESCAFAGFAIWHRDALRTRTQIRHATNCATPGRRQNGLAPLRSRTRASPRFDGSVSAPPFFLSKSKPSRFDFVFHCSESTRMIVSQSVGKFNPFLARNSRLHFPRDFAIL